MQSQLLLLVLGFCIFLFLPLASWCEEAPLVTFEQLQEDAFRGILPLEVTMRGFIYPVSEGQFILAGEPHLKSCCVGAAHHQQRQVILRGPFGAVSPAQAVTITGQLHVHSQEGENIYFSFENPSLLLRPTSWQLILEVNILLAAIAGFILYRRKTHPLFPFLRKGYLTS